MKAHGAAGLLRSLERSARAEVKLRQKALQEAEFTQRLHQQTLPLFGRADAI